MLCIRYHTPFPTAVIYAFPWRRNARLFLTAFFIFIAQSSFTGPKRGVFPPQFLLGNYSIQIIYCCQDLFPGIQPKWSFPLLSFTPLLLLQQITGMWKCIKWRHFFPKCFSYTQEFTKSKTLILTFFFALGTGVCISQQKVDVNCNKKYLSLAYSQLIWEGLGRFRFFFPFKIRKICEKHWPTLSGDRCFHLLQRICTEQQNVLLINFCRLASPAKLTSNWYNCFQQAKAHPHRCCQEGVDQSFVALLPLMAKHWSHLCTQQHLGNSQSHSSFQASSVPECQTLCKKPDTLKLENWEKKPKTQFCKRTKQHWMLICPNSLEIELIHNSWLDTA